MSILLYKVLNVSQKGSNGGAHVATMEGEGGGDIIDRAGKLDIMRGGADRRHGLSFSIAGAMDQTCINFRLAFRIRRGCSYYVLD
ncbi:hypothetical protein [Pararhizobium sp. DWP1-1-3]|uniref:hypothetical protein n=1 Tax=Pararhizobium sp. DWP1-1-3 TaxID=2804652 RepID=UPI003CFB9CF0